MFEMKLDESGHSDFSHVNVGEQILANQLSRLKQEQFVSLKEKVFSYRESLRFQKKDEGAFGFGKGRRDLLDFPYSYKNHATFSDSCGSSDTYCNMSSSGTGVFLPRGTSISLSDSYRRPGKGCSTVLIPARVVRALQLHFDQIAATSGPKSHAFPPLHDVLVSNKDGMYSLQKRQSRKNPTHIHNDVILPQEWTY